MELTMGDNLNAWAVIKYGLPERQGEIINAMGLHANLIQYYCPDDSIEQKILWNVWDMTGRCSVRPNTSSVKALIRKNIIIPTISNKEWEVQIALGTAEERVWKINPALFEPLINAECLIRTTTEKLKAGGVFDDNL